MANTLHLEIVTPDRLVLSKEVEYVGAPGYEGEFGIMANHIPFLSALKVGSLYYKEGGKLFYVFVAGGFAEISNNKVTILAEVAELAAEIDVDRAQKARERAQVRLDKRQEKMDYARVQGSLARSMARISCRERAQSAGTCQL
ncbi:F0F1 ATP synthase subunit epsilon [Desulfobaculum bizertense]|uniref:ATP synthase epsilon chain n=1 Tax=Desulfobaculum bizertense DSM 18034 TaxID=1121442 RepID=A0A1T4WU93_9BACT|nr:F0F1 ATP synthase subunit epsilon [Desulfobaculum bizertense]UIJ37250.1 F0F1 ATP synthase subunit epsilon [Desulfobaculum bizertense]SKA80201.1 F-type H+-transporting ATPase subunit epsilon [Desulfobaculum bizertense DSM 18034]